MKPVTCTVLLSSLFCALVRGTSSEPIPKLQLVATSHFKLGDSVASGETPEGSYSYVPIIGGYLNTTDGLVARILPGGNDNALIRTDGSYGIDVTVAAQDTAPPHDLFQIASFGYIPTGFVVNGTFTLEYGALNAYQVPRVNTASRKYGWLNGAALVGQESIVVIDSRVDAINLRIFQVMVQTNQQTT